MFRKPVGDSAYLAMLEPRHALEMLTLIDKNRFHLRQWLPWVDSTRGIMDSRMWIQAALKQFAENKELHAGIWFDDKLAGVIGCQFKWKNHSAVIGYWLGEDYQGKGLMTAAVMAYIDYCLCEMNLNRIEIRCATYNHRSRSIPERLGFKNEGTIRDAEWLYDRYVDHIIYGLLAKDWK